MRKKLKRNEAREEDEGKDGAREENQGKDAAKEENQGEDEGKQGGPVHPRTRSERLKLDRLKQGHQFSDTDREVAVID